MTILAEEANRWERASSSLLSGEGWIADDEARIALTENEGRPFRRTVTVWSDPSREIRLSSMSARLLS
jgi:hypothetical protein